MTGTTNWAARWVVGLVTVAVVVGGCSSSDDGAVETDASTTTTQASGQGSVAEQPTDGSDTGNADCTLLGQHRVNLQSYANQMSVLDSEEAFNLAVGPEGLDSMAAAIEAFRPYQDIETVFGTVQEGLDNLTTDVTAAREGQFQFGEPSGNYGVAGFSALLEELGC
jgi:hypothetical protein